MAKARLSSMQIYYLIGHFFGRFFDTEAMATLHADMHLLVVNLLGLLVLPGLLKTWLSVTKYSFLAWFPIAGRDSAVLNDSYFFLCLSMLLTGFITVFEWDTLFPDNKDYNNLTPLPIPPHVVFFAKGIALCAFVVLFHAAINIIPTLMFPNVVLAASFKSGTAGWHIPPGESLRYIAAHALSLFLSTIFVFTSLITLHAVFRLVIPARFLRIVSRTSQLIVILMFVCAFFSGGTADRQIAEAGGLDLWMPTFWFLGVYQVLINHQSAANLGLAHKAYSAVLVTTVLSVITYTISYQSSMRKGFQSAGLPSYGVTPLKRGWARLLHAAVLRDPIERASFHFVAQTTFRRHEHMLYWGSFVSVGIAFVLSDLQAIGISSRHLISLLASALMMSSFILIGLRFVYTVPADLHANWIFKIMDEQLLKRSHGGVRKFMIAAVMVPLMLLLAPLYLMILGPYTVGGHIIYVSIVSLMLLEVLLFRLKKFPFTCSYLPGKVGTLLLWPVYVLIIYCYCYGMAYLETWLLEDAKRYVLFVSTLVFLLVLLNRHRVRFLNKSGPILFEEKPADQMTVLSIDG